MPLFRRLGRTDEQERRKRNLLIIGGILVLLVVATIFEVGIRHPRIPFASNLIVFALFVPAHPELLPGLYMTAPM